MIPKHFLTHSGQHARRQRSLKMDDVVGKHWRLIYCCCCSCDNPPPSSASPLSPSPAKTATCSAMSAMSLQCILPAPPSHLFLPPSCPLFSVSSYLVSLPDRLAPHLGNVQAVMPRPPARFCAPDRKTAILSQIIHKG